MILALRQVVIIKGEQSDRLYYSGVFSSVKQQQIKYIFNSWDDIYIVVPAIALLEGNYSDDDNPVLITARFRLISITFGHKVGFFYI